MKNTRNQFTVTQEMTQIQKKYILQITNNIYDLPIAAEFRDPVETKEYYEKLKKPMDLSIVLHRIKKNEYQSVEKWKEDMNLIWKNYQNVYSDQRQLPYIIASELARLFKDMSDNIPRTEIEEWKYKCKQATLEIGTITEARPDQQKKLINPSGLLKLKLPVKQHKILLRVTSQTIEKQ